MFQFVLQEGRSDNLQRLCFMGILDTYFMISMGSCVVYVLYFEDIIPQSNSLSKDVIHFS